MERRASRTRTAKQSTGFLQSGVSRGILSMARDFHRGAIGSLDAPGLLASARFDEAFVAALPRIYGECGADFDTAGFRKKLMDEAGSVTFRAVLPGQLPLDGRADLFAIPLSGALDGMESFTEDAGSLLAFSRSFRNSGLAGRGASIVLAPVLVDPWTAGDAMPGQIRTLVELLQRPLSDPHASIGSAVSSVLGTSMEPIRVSRDMLGNRLLLGVRVQLVPKDEGFGDDVFVAPNTGDHDDLSHWSEETRKLLPPGVMASPPTTFSRAAAVMAFERIITGLIAECHDSQFDLSAGFDEVHVHDDGQDVHVCAIIGGRSLGPASAPSHCALADAAWFAAETRKLSRTVMWSDAYDLLPTSSYKAE